MLELFVPHLILTHVIRSRLQLVDSVLQTKSYRWGGLFTRVALPFVLFLGTWVRCAYTVRIRRGRTTPGQSYPQGPDHTQQERHN